MEGLNLTSFWLLCQENEIASISSLISNIKNGNLSEESEELAKLMTENSKLKLRLEVLNRVSNLNNLQNLQEINSQ